MPTRHKDLFLISTTDFFYPLVDDPYIQGKIACANVLSDLYAMGVVNCDNMLMILGVSEGMKQPEKDITTSQMIAGFNDLAHEAGTSVTGGQTVKNPWPIIGGVAFSLCSTSEFIRPVSAIAGDVIVLTKALGTNVVTNVHKWLEVPDQWKRVSHVISEEDVKRGYQLGMQSMEHLNRAAAQLMLKYSAHAATDITGFGILGHARNLAGNQEADVSFEIHTLPMYRGCVACDQVWAPFKLVKGTSPETSGGLFICLPEAAAQAFCDELRAVDGLKHGGPWVVGRVVAGNKTAAIVDQVKIVEV
eukprot:TRINITY_DN3716_c0_g1_i1.p1 TRINITY_DN3716_c0_g1~~TRINITY_DN3716_c0_g1_i1.p1  ORF type:complete len:303 (+),score=73.45 TRINITY_DN3716_c0_g1_i1:280-1188(+)